MACGSRAISVLVQSPYLQQKNQELLAEFEQCHSTFMSIAAIPSKDKDLPVSTIVGERFHNPLWRIKVFVNLLSVCLLQSSVHDGRG